MHVRLEAGPNGSEEFLDKLKIYALLAPHMDGGGAGNSARVADVAGRKVLVAWKNRWTLAMSADCGFAGVSCGFVGASDGWRATSPTTSRWTGNFGSATNGNLALMGELDMRGSREFTLGIGIGDSPPLRLIEDHRRPSRSLLPRTPLVFSSNGNAQPVLTGSPSNRATGAC